MNYLSEKIEALEIKIDYLKILVAQQSGYDKFIKNLSEEKQLLESILSKLTEVETNKSHMNVEELASEHDFYKKLDQEKISTVMNTCPQCHDRGNLYDDKGICIGTCSCHL